jgi:ADP-ribosyl-[dinitrogen reductase] hydrolase
MKTSISHPLQIAVATAGSEFGRIGITFCPGKFDPHAMTGGWDRDLNRDLDAIRDWGAAAVVTLLEPKELTLLRVERSVIFDLLKPPRRRRRARAAV